SRRTSSLSHSISGEESAAGSVSMSTARASPRILLRAPISTAAPISCRVPAIARNVTRQRNIVGSIIADQTFAGAHEPDGKGTVPNITPSPDGIGDWSEEDIVYFLETGNTPDYDTVGGSMAAVQRNMAKLTPEDREGIALYLKSLPPRPDAVPKSERSQA